VRALVSALGVLPSTCIAALGARQVWRRRRGGPIIGGSRPARVRASGHDRRGDALAVDAGLGEQLRGCARGRHRCDCEADDRNRRGVRGERLEHGRGDAALRPVILDDDDRAGLRSRVAQRCHVDRLDRVKIDHPDRDAVRGEHVSRRQRLAQGDPSRDDGYLVAVSAGANDA